jgi:hypothetical protein
VGVPVSDGGAGAISRALGQVAGAAQNIGQSIKRRQDALATQAVSDASSKYETQVREWSNKLRIAAASSDGDGVLAAQKELDTLKDTPINAFLEATDKPLRISDDMWKAGQQRAESTYVTLRGAADLATVNSQYTARFSRGLKSVGSTSSALIEKGVVGAGGFADVDAEANALAAGDLAAGATPSSLEGLQQDLANVALNHIQSFGVLKDSYTSISAYNKDVDQYLGILQKSGAYGDHKGRLLKAVEALRIQPPKGKKVSLTDAANKRITSNRETLGASVFVSPEALLAQRDIVEQNKGLDLTDSAKGRIDSLALVTDLTEWFGGSEVRKGLTQWAASNVGKSGRDFLTETLEEGSLVNLSAEDRKAFIKHVDHTINSFTQVPVETNKRAPAGSVIYNTALSRAAEQPEFSVKLKTAETALNNALDSFDLDNPEESYASIREAVDNYNFVTYDDHRKQEFVGMNKLVEYIESNPNNGRAIVAAANVASQLWGPVRSANFIASFPTDSKNISKNLLVAGMNHNAVFGDDVDVQGMRHVSVGARAAEWLNTNKETPKGAKYELWDNYRTSGDASISKVYNQFKQVPQEDASYWLNFIKGFAISKIEQNPELSIKEIDELVTNTVNDRVMVVEAFGNSSMSLRAKREDGTFSGAIESFVRRLPRYAGDIAAGALPFVTREDVRPFTTMISEFGGTSLTEQEYAEGRVQKAVETFISSGNLQHNIQSFGSAVDLEVAKMTQPEDQIREMMVNGELRLSHTLNKDGVGAYTIEVRTLRENDQGNVLDQEWTPLVGDDGNAFPVSERLIDINYEDKLDLDAATKAHKRSRWIRARTVRSGPLVPSSFIFKPELF